MVVKRIKLVVNQPDGSKTPAQGGGVVLFDQSGRQTQHRPAGGDGSADFGAFGASGIDFMASADGCSIRHGYITDDPVKVVPKWIYLVGDEVEVDLDPFV